MKKFIKRIVASMCMALVLVFTFSLPVMADGTDTSTFDFGQTVMSVKQGGSSSIRLYARAQYVYYIEGNTSKKTYCECSGNSGSQTITFHIGSDEKAGGTVTFWFYIEDTDHHDNVQIRVVQSANSTTASSQSVATVSSALPQVASTPVSFGDGSTGIVSVTGNFAGLVSNAANVPLAAFSITDSKGNALQMQLQNVVTAGGISYIGVFPINYSGVVKTVMSENDKAAMIARGIAGIYVNQQYVLWS